MKKLAFSLSLLFVPIAGNCQVINLDTTDLGDLVVKTKKPGAKPAKTIYRFEQTDMSFKQALFRWSKIAGYQIEYEAEKDFPGRISSDLSDDFKVAVKLATAAYKNSDYPLKACSYSNKVIRIVRFQGSGKECKID